MSPEKILQNIKEYHAHEKSTNKVDGDEYDHGRRLDFGRLASDRYRVKTNYLQIDQRPQKIFVYQIAMVREFKEKADGTREPQLFKRRNEMAAIFETLKSLDGYDRLNSQTSYVTDYDMIWSVRPLFDDSDETVVPPPCSQVNGTNPVTHVDVHAHEVSITFGRLLDMRLSPAQMFKDQTGSIKGDEDPAVLSRGINAFMMHHASMTASTNGLTSVGRNTFFRNVPARPLDGGRTIKVLRGYCLSLRRGTQRLLLNVNLKHSPFLEPCKITDWITNCWNYARTDGNSRSMKETFSILKGKIAYQPGLGSRRPWYGIITGVGRIEDQDVTTWAEVDALVNND